MRGRLRGVRGVSIFYSYRFHPAERVKKMMCERERQRFRFEKSAKRAFLDKCKKATTGKPGHGNRGR